MKSFKDKIKEIVADALEKDHPFGTPTQQEKNLADLIKKLGKKLKPEEEEINPKILKRIRLRKELSCDFCPPNRSENKKQHKKHGTRKPKSKNKRS